MSDDPTTDVTQEQDAISLLHHMDNDQLLSAMTLADRDKRYDDFTVYRREIMYRLRCAEPLINWYKPTRI